MFVYLLAGVIFLILLIVSITVLIFVGRAIAAYRHNIERGDRKPLLLFAVVLIIISAVAMAGVFYNFDPKLQGASGALFSPPFYAGLGLGLGTFVVSALQKRFKVRSSRQ